jgi:hypothetical protein
VSNRSRAPREGVVAVAIATRAPESPWRRAEAGALESVAGRREELIPWQHEQIEWANEVGGVFQAELDAKLLREERGDA